MLGLLLTLLSLVPSPDPLNVLRELMERGQFNEAAHFFDPGEEARLAALSPDWCALFARAHHEIGSERRARTLLELVPKRAHAVTDFALARIEIATDHLDRAWELLVSETSADQPLHAQHSTAWILLGRVAFRRGEAGRARPLLEQALKLSPHDADAPSAWHMLGNEARERRDIARARECFQKSTKLRRWHELYRARRIQSYEHPDDPLPHYGIGLMWMELGQLDRAQDAFLESCIRANRAPVRADYAPSVQMLAEVQRQMGELSKALSNFGTALGMDPTLPLARAQRGAMHAEAGRWAKAVLDLDVFSALPEASRKDFRIAHWHHTRALDALGRTAQADQTFTRYLALGGKRARSR